MTDDGCLYERLLAAEGYERSVVTKKHDYEEKPKQERGVVDLSRPPAGRRRLRQHGDKSGAGNHQHEQGRVVQH